MPVNVYIPTSLRSLVGNRARVEANGENVAGLLDELVQRYPEMQARLYDGDGELHRFINIYVNNREIEELAPRRVLALTGWNWASDVVGGLPVQWKEPAAGKYVERIGQANGSVWVVAPHPQGKPRDKVVDQVSRAYASRH